MSSTQTQTKTGETWWDEDGPIPGPDLEQTGIVVRQAQGAQLVQRRSEYAELAELAAAHGPRNTTTLLQEARRVGALLGSRAYYDFPAGGGRVTGPSIDLMDALAIVWGRLVQRVEVLEETQDRVHLRGRIVDLLALTATERDYVSAIAPAPGKFANKPDQIERWRVMQIQSASSKAVRGALEHALPAWLVDAALDAARNAASQQATGGRPLPEARLMAVEALGRFGLDRATLEAHVEQPMDLWTSDELAQLRTLRDGLKSGQIAAEAVIAEAALKSASRQPQHGQDKLGSLGLSKPSSSPSPSSPPVEAPAAPASGGDQARETRPSRDPGAHASALRAKLQPRLDKGELVWHDEVKAALKGVMGTSRIALDTIHATVSYGAERGWWTVSTQRNDAQEVTGYGVAPVAEEPEPAQQRHTTPWDKLVGTALEAAFSALINGTEDEDVAAAHAEAGVGEHDEPTEDQMRAIGRALEAL